MALNFDHGLNTSSRVKSPNDIYAADRQRLRENPGREALAAKYVIDYTRKTTSHASIAYRHTLDAFNEAQRLRRHFPKATGFTVFQRQDKQAGVVGVFVRWDADMDVNP